MITITKNKIYRSPFTLKKTKHDSKEIEALEMADLVYILGEELELGEDVTFKDLFDIIIFHKDFLNILFNKEMGGLLIDDFIEDYEKDSKFPFENEGFNLRLAWYSDIFEYNHEVEFVEYVGFEAYGKLNVKEDDEDYTISLAFVSLSEIKNKLIVLDNTFELHDDESYKSDIGAFFKANYKPFTIYDVFRAILRDITFYGDPEKRDKQREQLEQEAINFTSMLTDEELEEGEFVLWGDGEGEIELDDIKSNEDFETFWETIYPKKKTEKSEEDKITASIIAISNGSGLSLEEQLQEAHDSEDYEKAAKLKKIIDKRDGNE